MSTITDAIDDLSMVDTTWVSKLLDDESDFSPLPCKIFSDTNASVEEVAARALNEQAPQGALPQPGLRESRVVALPPPPSSSSPEQQGPSEARTPSPLPKGCIWKMVPSPESVTGRRIAVQVTIPAIIYVPATITNVLRKRLADCL